jgi:hypothetical protein
VVMVVAVVVVVCAEGMGGVWLVGRDAWALWVARVVWVV